MSNASGSIADTSAGHLNQFMPNTERGSDVLPSGYEILQNMDWDCDLGLFDEYQIPLSAERQPEMLIYPEEEGGAVRSTGKRKRDKNWTKVETSNLITLKKAFAENGSQTRKGKSEWDAIAEKMSTLRTGDQCRLRWDTLIKSFQKIKKYCGNNKTISELTPMERSKLKLATTISEDWWYDVIGQSLPPRHRKSTSLKLDDPSIPDVNNVPLPSTLPFGTPPTQTGSDSSEPEDSSARKAAVSGMNPMKRDSNPASDPQLPSRSLGFQPTREAYPEQIAIPGFNSMSHNLKCTLLSMILAWPTIGFNSEMEAACRWLAFLHDRKLTDTRSFVLELRERNLLSFCKKEAVIWLRLGNLQMYSEFAKQVVRTHCYRVGVYNMLTFESITPLRQISVLTLSNCLQLERVDLGNFPLLRSLVMRNCPVLESVCGWKYLLELRWLEMDGCQSYRTYPELHYLSSLREARLQRRISSQAPIGFVPNFSQCIRMSRLEISGDDQLKESGDLSTLKCLKLLSFLKCQALCTITGLSGLHSLTKLNLEDCESLKSLPGLAHLKSLQELKLSGSGVEEITDLEELYCVTHLDLGFCKALRTLPHLGHLKELDHLNISGSNVEDISVLKELHSLSKLDLSGCEALKTLPHLGHMTALAELSVDFTGVEEIPGVEMLVGLETMDCYRSQLKWLPALHHLPRLEWVDLRGTPVTGMDPLSIYFEKGIVRCHKEVAKIGVSVTDVTDREHAHFDEGLYDKYREFYPPKCDILN